MGVITGNTNTVAMLQNRGDVTAIQTSRLTLKMLSTNAFKAIIFAAAASGSSKVSTPV